MDQRVGCTHLDPRAGGVCAGRVPLCEDKSAHLSGTWPSLPHRSAGAHTEASEATVWGPSTETSHGAEAAM